MLSDLNKHMRTVHGTYRRKAKIPKDLISEMDNPDADLLPQIYGTSSNSNPSNIPETPAQKPVQKQQSIPRIPTQSAVKTPVKKPKSSPSKTPSPRTVAKNNNYDLVENDNVTMSIKQELGLSSGGIYDL